jgi:hypothetical protein
VLHKTALRCVMASPGCCSAAQLLCVQPLQASKDRGVPHAHSGVSAAAEQKLIKEGAVAAVPHPVSVTRQLQQSIRLGHHPAPHHPARSTHGGPLHLCCKALYTSQAGAALLACGHDFLVMQICTWLSNNGAKHLGPILVLPYSSCCVISFFQSMPLAHACSLMA